jgi:Zn-dependent protease with chaperone function
MHEHVARALYYVGIHLLYASVAGCAVWALTSIRGATATAKYWMWVLAVANFIVPVGAMTDRLLAPHLTWAEPLGVVGGAVWTMTEGRTAWVTAGIWLVGAAVMTARLIARLRSERRELVTGPAVSGLLRPRIVLPHDIDDVLTPEELDAVVLHELTHARRRDNLIRLVYEFTLCLLWFHPIIWVAGSRIAVYRELSCDESVTGRTSGRALISALAKLAAPQNTPFLHATAAAHIRERLMLLEAPRQASAALNILLIVLFASIMGAGIFGTVAHTACCFVLGR